MITCVIIKPEPFEQAVRRMQFQITVLAKELGISRPYLTILKRGRVSDSHPSPALRRRMLKVLNVKFDDIFEIVEIPKPKEKKPIPLASEGC